MKILSIQSAVAYGHVGNSAAVFPLQRIGVEVLPVYTVTFSNHTGYGAWRGPLISPDDVRDVIIGIEERGVFGEIDVVLSGYQGSDGIGDVILDAVARVKAANPAAVYSCDPVMGNAKSGCFVAPAIPILLRERVVPAADIITPNQFELGRLVGERPDTVEGVIEAARILNARGTGRTVVTGCVLTDTAAGEVETVAVEGGVAHRVSIPRIPIRPSGTGDLFTAYLTGWLMRGEALAEAAARATAGVQTVLLRTQAAGAFEMRLTEG